VSLSPDELDRLLGENARLIRKDEADERLRRYWDLSSLSVRGTAPRPCLDFHQDLSFGRILEGGNKSAKSTAGCVESYWWSTGTHPFRPTPKPPCKGRIIVPELPLGEKPHPIRDLVKFWYPEDCLLGGSWEKAWQIQARTLLLNNESKIEFVSWQSVELAQAGLQDVAWVWFDEELPRYYWVENKTRVDRQGSGWWMTYAPTGRYPWIDKELVEETDAGKHPGFQCFHVTVYDNSHNLDFSIEQWAEGMSDSEKARRLYGKTDVVEGRIFDLDVPVTKLTGDDFDLEHQEPE